MREFVLIIAGITAFTGWMLLWLLLLRIFEPQPFLWKLSKLEKRERMMSMGKLRYLFVYGVLGSGMAWALAMTIIMTFDRPVDWEYRCIMLLLLALAFGIFHGTRNWRRTFWEPVPYPPKYD